MDLVVEILGMKNAMFAWAFAWYDIVVATVDLGVTGFGDLWVKGRLWWQIELQLLVSDVDLLEVDRRRDDKFFGDWWCEWKQISGLHRKERERSLTKRRDKIFGFKNWNGVFICFNNFCLFQRKVAFKIAGKFQSLKYLCICCSVWLPRKWEKTWEKITFFFILFILFGFFYIIADGSLRWKVEPPCGDLGRVKLDPEAQSSLALNSQVQWFYWDTFLTNHKRFPF